MATVDPNALAQTLAAQDAARAAWAAVDVARQQLWASWVGAGASAAVAIVALYLSQAGERRSRKLRTQGAARSLQHAAEAVTTTIAGFDTNLPFLSDDAVAFKTACRNAQETLDRELTAGIEQTELKSIAIELKAIVGRLLADLTAGTSMAALMANRYKDIDRIDEILKELRRWTGRNVERADTQPTVSSPGD